MEEVMRLIQIYNDPLAKAAVLLMGVILIVLAAGISRKIKRLNKSLESIVDNMQAYFDVILQEEEEPEPQTPPVKVRQTYPSSESRGGQAYLSTEPRNGQAYPEKTAAGQANAAAEAGTGQAHPSAEALAGQAYLAETKAYPSTEPRRNQSAYRSEEVGRQANGLKEQKNMEDEKLVNAMLQEYFS